MRFTYQTGAQPLAGYTIQRGIHRGGFGEVYFARSDGGKEVALKLLHQQDQEIEIRGVTQCLNLKHPNLVNLFDVKMDHHGDHWIVMEYVAGSNLEDVLASFPDGLPLGEVREWLSGLVAGVAHLHDRGIVHRDLKPANVYRENGVVKVGDVGLSKRLDSDHRRQHTQSVGTVYYMAPEVAQGQYGPEVDVYSLGVMLYEMITGKLPFNGETTAEILMKHLTAQPDLSPIPRELRPTLARVLEKDPAKRTPTVRDLEREFLQAQSSRQIPSAVAAASSSHSPSTANSPAQNVNRPQSNGAFSEPYTIPESSFLPPVPPSGSESTPRQAPRRHQHAEHERTHRTTEPPRAAQSRNDNASRLEPRHWLLLSVMLGMILLLTGSIRGSVPIGHARIPSAVGFVILAFLVVPTAGFALLHSFKTFLNRIVFADEPRTGSPQFARGPSVETPPPWQEFRAQSANTRPARRAAAAAAGEHRSRYDSRPWNEKLPELANSLGYAALVASLLSAVVYVVLSIPLRTDRPNPFMPSPETAVLFVATSIVGAWLMLAGHAVTSGSAWTNRQRWLFRLATGALLGSISYALDQFLMVDYPPAAFNAKPVLKWLGKYSLVEDGFNPTWLAYAWFFAGWMGFRRWSREMDLHRKESFRIGTVVSAVAVAFLMSWVFRFPQVYAMFWAGTISTTVQLASRSSPSQPAWERR